MKPVNNPYFSFSPFILILVFGFFVLFWLFGTNIFKGYFTTSVIKSWNTVDSNVTTNGNALRALTYLETQKNNLTPITPIPSAVFNKPSKYYAKYLQFSGTVKSVQPSSPPSRLESILNGSSSEILVLANDGRTLIDFFLIGRNQNFTPGAPITLYGYTPGIRYIQYSQVISTSGLVLIGRLQH